MQPLGPAPLWRRLAAAAYDALLLLALFAVLGFVDALARKALGLAYDRHALRALLFLGGLGFCGWCWVHGGQTLGMRAWRLRVQRADGGTLSWPTAALRYSVACLSWGLAGAGLWWCLIDPRRRSWHDLAAGTEVLQLPKNLSAPSAAGTPPAP